MSRFYQDAGGRWMTSTLSGFPKFVPAPQKPADQCQPFDTVGRILDLEKQVAELRGREKKSFIALAKRIAELEHFAANSKGPDHD